jgi:hypothetical protein
MFNKKLIAGSIFALISAPALAVPTFTYTADEVSQEGAAQLVSLTLPEVVMTSGAEYSDDDLIVVDYNVALAANYTPASTLLMYATCDAGATGTAVNNGGELTLGLLSSDAAAGSLTYRITDVDYTAAGACGVTDNSSVGAVLSFATPKVDGAAALAAGSVTGTYHATLPNGTTDIDGGVIAFALNDADPMVSYEGQFSDAAGTNSVLAGIVDVTGANPRSAFTVGGQVAVGGFTLEDDISLSFPADITGLTFTLNGDFSYLVDEDADTVGIQNDAWSLDLDINVAGADEVYEATTVTASAITWVITENAGLDALDIIDDVSVDFDNGSNGDGTNPMANGTYTYDVTVAYDDLGTDGIGDGFAAGSVAVTAGGAAGAFTLNGSTSTISNYPLSSAVTQFVWVTNDGSQDGDIFATAFGGTGAQTMASCDLGVSSGAGEIIRITDELNTCLATAGMTAGRAEIVITVNADGDDISVYAGYKHDADADRLNLTQ